MAKILISMSENFLKTVDELADIEQRTRSELIREALRNYIRKTNKRISKNAIKSAGILEKLLD